MRFGNCMILRLTRVARTRALSPCSDNTLAHGGCLRTAAAPTPRTQPQVGSPWRPVPPSKAMNQHLVRSKLQCGASSNSRSPSALQWRVNGGESAAWSGRARRGTKPATRRPSVAALADQVSARRTTQSRGPAQVLSLLSAPAARASTT